LEIYLDNINKPMERSKEHTLFVVLNLRVDLYTV
jgi:hypothetical protein